MARQTPQQKAARLAQLIRQEVIDAAGLGLNAARIFLQARIKETLNESADRRKAKVCGKDSYVAITGAVPKAPPRKVTGRLQQTLTSEMVSPTEAQIGANAKGCKTEKYPDGFPYPKYHEIVDLPPFKKSGSHQYIEPTAEKHMNDLIAIVGGPVKLIKAT